jgi:drug/metabolite transporter (DMT)-like permease
VSRVLGFLILFTCIGGLTPVFGKLAVSEIPWMTLAWVRFGTAGVLLALTQRAMGGRLPLSRATITPLLGIAALCVPINQLGFLLGLRLANAGHAGVFYALNPVLIFWIGLALGRGVFRWSLCAATLLAFAGAVCVVASSGDLAAGDAKPDLLAGDLLLLLAIVSWALFSLLSKPYVQRHGAVGTLAAVFLLGTLLHTPFMLLDVGQVDWAAITWRGWLGAGFITLVTSYLNYLLWYVVISRHDMTRASVVVNANFLITIAVGWAFLGETVNRLFFAGALLVLAGIALVTHEHWRQRSMHG